MVKHTMTVAVSAPLNGMPVPAVDRIAGFTTTMYDIVKNVVMPAARSREKGPVPAVRAEPAGPKDTR